MSNTTQHLTQGQQSIIAEHCAFHEARGHRPRWCAAHGPGVSLWVGDEPCVQCEQERRAAAGLLPPLGVVDRELLARGITPAWMLDEPGTLDAYVRAGEVAAVAHA